MGGDNQGKGAEMIYDWTGVINCLNWIIDM